MKTILTILFFIFFTHFFSSEIYAEKLSDKNYPTFYSLKYDETNVRSGPGINYPIKWIFQGNNIPIEIITKFNHWYKIHDIQGDTGWIHSTLISSSRKFIVQNNNSILYRKPGQNAIAQYKLENNVRGKIMSCLRNWCEINIDGIYGWIEKTNIWGVYDHENI